MKPESALRQLPEWGRTFQQRDRDFSAKGQVDFSRSRNFGKWDRSPFPGRERISVSGGKEEGHLPERGHIPERGQVEAERKRDTERKRDRSGGTGHLPEKGQVDKASRTSNPTFVSLSFSPGVRITERRLFPVGPTEKEFLHREFLGFSQALGGNGCTKSHENRKPWRSMHPSRGLHR